MLSRNSSVKTSLRIPRERVSGIVNVGPSLSLNCCICKGFSCDDHVSACAVSGGCGSFINELFTVDWSEDCGGRACCMHELFV